MYIIRISYIMHFHTPRPTAINECINCRYMENLMLNYCSRSFQNYMFVQFPTYNIYPIIDTWKLLCWTIVCLILHLPFFCIIHLRDCVVYEFCRAMGDVSDRIGRPTDNGQVCRSSSLRISGNSGEFHIRGRSNDLDIN